MAETPDFSGLPGWLQAVVSAVVLAAGAFFTIRGYFARLPTPPAPPGTQLTAQVIGQTLAERYATDRLAEAIESAVPVIEKLIEAHRRDAEDRNRNAIIIERAINNVGEDIQQAIERAAERHLKRNEP